MHPSYPTRPLHKEWRVGYVRRGRLLASVFVVQLMLWVGAVWMVMRNVLPQ